MKVNTCLVDGHPSSCLWAWRPNVVSVLGRPSRPPVCVPATGATDGPRTPSILFRAGCSEWLLDTRNERFDGSIYCVTQVRTSPMRSNPESLDAIDEHAFYGRVRGVIDDDEVRTISDLQSSPVKKADGLSGVLRDAIDPSM